MNKFEVGDLVVIKDRPESSSTVAIVLECRDYGVMYTFDYHRYVLQFLDGHRRKWFDQDYLSSV